MKQFAYYCDECKQEITDPTEANVMWIDADMKREAMSAVRTTHCVDCSSLDPAWRDSCSNTLGIFDGSAGVERAARFVFDVKLGTGIAPMWLLGGAYARRDARSYVWKASGIGPYLVNPVTMIAK